MRVLFSQLYLRRGQPYHARPDEVPPSPWSKVSDVTSLTSTSKVYFTQETEDGYYEIYFGDGVLGSALEDGNLILIEYLVTNGIDANDLAHRNASLAQS